MVRVKVRLDGLGLWRGLGCVEVGESEGGRGEREGESGYEGLNGREEGCGRG